MQTVTHGRRTRERVWMLSPALVTALFFALDLGLASERSSDAELQQSGAETPSLVVERRVQAPIRAAERLPEPTREVPQTEEDLLDLIEKQGIVVFEAEEVAVEARAFAADEVDVIRVQGRLRAARLVKAQTP